MPKAPKASERLLIISNRAPYSLRRRGRTNELVRSIGGLASTLDDTLRRHGGVWLAWSGNAARAARNGHRPKLVRSLRTPDGGYRLRLLDHPAQGRDARWTRAKDSRV